MADTIRRFFKQPHPDLKLLGRGLAIAAFFTILDGLTAWQTLIGEGALHICWGYVSGIAVPLAIGLWIGWQATRLGWLLGAVPYIALYVTVFLIILMGLLAGVEAESDVGPGEAALMLLVAGGAYIAPGLAGSAIGYGWRRWQMRKAG